MLESSNSFPCFLPTQTENKREDNGLPICSPHCYQQLFFQLGDCSSLKRRWKAVDYGTSSAHSDSRQSLDVKSPGCVGSWICKCLKEESRHRNRHQTKGRTCHIPNELHEMKTCQTWINEMTAMIQNDRITCRQEEDILSKMGSRKPLQRGDPLSCDLNDTVEPAK